MGNGIEALVSQDGFGQVFNTRSGIGSSLSRAPQQETLARPRATIHHSMSVFAVRSLT